MQTPNIHNTTPETGQNSFADNVANNVRDLSLAADLVAFGSNSLPRAIAVNEFLESEECFLPKEAKEHIEAILCDRHASFHRRSQALVDLRNVLVGNGYILSDENFEGGDDDDWSL